MLPTAPLHALRLAAARSRVAPALAARGWACSLPQALAASAPLPISPAPLRAWRRRPFSTAKEGDGKPAEAPVTDQPATNADGAAPAAAEPTTNTRGPVSWATFFLLLASGTGAIVYYNVQRAQRKAEAQTKVESFGKAALGGHWALVDSAGVPVTSGDLLGRYYLLYFGFTFCPDICPNEMVKMGRAVDLFEKKGADGSLPDIIPVFVTLDPHRDSCAQVGTYVKDFHPRMVALTGTPTQVARMAKKFRVYFAEVDRNEDDEDYLVDHSIVMYLMGPDGQFIDFYTQLMSAPEIAEKMAGTIARLEKEAGRGPQAGGLGAWLGGLLGGK